MTRRLDCVVGLVLVACFTPTARVETASPNGHELVVEKSRSISLKQNLSANATKKWPQKENLKMPNITSELKISGHLLVTLNSLKYMQKCIISPILKWSLFLAFTWLLQLLHISDGWYLVYIFSYLYATFTLNADMLQDLFFSSFCLYSLHSLTVI